MDPIPKVVLSNFIWKISDDGIHRISPTSRLKCCFTGYGDSTSGMARLTWNTKGYWWLGRELRLALPASEGVIVNVLSSTEDERETTLGSIYIELDQVFHNLNSSPPVTECSYTSALESNNCPLIQLSFSVASFIPAADLVLPTRPPSSTVSKLCQVSHLAPLQRLRFDAYSTPSIVRELRLYGKLPSAYKLSGNMPDFDLALTSLRNTELPASWFSPERERPAEVSTLTFATGRRFEQLPSDAQDDWQVALQGFDNSMEFLMLESPLTQSFFFKRHEISQIKLWQGGPEQILFLLQNGIETCEHVIATSEQSDDLLALKHSLAASLFLLCEAHELEALCPLAERILHIERVIELLRECLRILSGSGYSFSYTVTDGSTGSVEKVAWTPPGLNASDQPRDVNHLRELLGSALWTRFGFLQERRDLDEAITFLSGVPLDHSETTVFKLAGMLYERYFHHGRDHRDIQHAISALSAVATSPKLGAPTKRFFAAYFWAECAEAVNDVRSRMSAFEIAMSIITNVVWVGMAMQDRHDILTMTLTSFGYASALAQSGLRCMKDDIGHVPGLAAACAIEYGEYPTAIEWLEQGRSIIWDQLLQLRVPLEGLKKSNKPLAERLEGIAKELAISSAQTRFGTEGTNAEFKMLDFLEGDSRGQTHKRLSMEWQKAIIEARSLPGQGKFLRTKEFDELLLAASDSTVIIINFDADRCDALVVFPPDGVEGLDRVLHVPLSKVEGFLQDVGNLYAELLDLIRSSDERRPVATPSANWNAQAVFMQVLSVLWESIVFPILKSCRDARPRLFSSTTRPRVRWCPTGPLTFLPLHAAGDYSISQKGHKVYDFVISSYIPTFSSIIRPKLTGRRKPQILAVSCAAPKGYAPIFGTQRELRNLKAHAASAGCDMIEVAAGNATAERVLEEIKDAQWVHFACHGIQDAMSPTQSALILQNSTRVTLADFAALNIPHAELAYLSACQTATGYDAVPSESIHLAAGVLLAGYRSVIATMWSIQDRYAPEIADDVYGYLLRGGEAGVPDYRESSIALDLAVGRLRNKVGEQAFMSWVPYIHMGA